MRSGGFADRQPLRLRPDPSRVIARLFVPGHYLAGEGRHATDVVGRVLALSPDEVDEALSATISRFGARHRDLLGLFEDHAARIANRLEPGTELSEQRRLLLGATFTHEYAVEAAAVCNPSMVALTDQADTPTGSLRVVMSVRQIGEGHRSSVGFRTAVVDEHGEVTFDAPARYATAAVVETSTLDVASFRTMVDILEDTDADAIDWVLTGLPDPFTMTDLEHRLTQLGAQRDTRRGVPVTVRRLRELATRFYTARAAEDSALGERILHPAIALESHGMEDARFVRFVDDDGSVTYLATYAAFDGIAASQQLLATTDFRTFHVTPLLGAAAGDKGMALFPRRIDGRFVALSRHDRSGNSVAFSDDLHRWRTAVDIECPPTAWEAVQVGNCGSPIETERGWLVLTHGVGPMRTYSIGAWLLDIDDPTRVIGRLREPLLSPLVSEQDGYVPNVVYSCGAVVHAGMLVIPYGIGDAAIGIATTPLDALLDLLDTTGLARPRR